MSSQQHREWQERVATLYVRRIEGRLGLRRQRVRLIFDKQEIRAAKVPDNEAIDWYEGCHGAYLPHLDVLYLNLESHHILRDLYATICHELVHRRFPQLQHGEVFDRRVLQVYKGRRFIPIILVKSDSLIGND